MLVDQVSKVSCIIILWHTLHDRNKLRILKTVLCNGYHCLHPNPGVDVGIKGACHWDWFKGPEIPRKWGIGCKAHMYN